MAIQISLFALVAMIITLLGVGLLRSLAPRLGLIDLPNPRSSHSRPTPRGGGLAFALAVPVLVPVAFLWMGTRPAPAEVALLLGGLLVAAVGLADDRWGLPVRLKLLAYLLAAAVLVVGGGYLRELQWPGAPPVALGWMGIPVTLLWVVGLTNGYNFMDGVDGMAAGQAVVAAGTVALLACWRGEPHIALFTSILAGGSLGFLFHNWPPARIFMGDVGSAFLGYSFAGLALLSDGDIGGASSLWLWVVLLAPFLFDTSLTLALRIARGERWFEAHRQHLYQRLTRLGWSHLRVTSLYLAADLLLAGVVLAHFALGLEGYGLALGASLPPAGILLLVKRTEATSPEHRFASGSTRQGL